jgi:hypothetical protein
MSGLDGPVTASPRNSIELPTLEFFWVGPCEEFAVCTRASKSSRIEAGSWSRNSIALVVVSALKVPRQWLCDYAAASGSEEGSRHQPDQLAWSKIRTDGVAVTRACVGLEYRSTEA